MTKQEDVSLRGMIWIPIISTAFWGVVIQIPVLVQLGLLPRSLSGPDFFAMSVQGVAEHLLMGELLLAAAGLMFAFRHSMAKP